MYKCKLQWAGCSGAEAETADLVQIAPSASSLPSATFIPRGRWRCPRYERIFVGTAFVLHTPGTRFYTQLHRTSVCIVKLNLL